MSLEALIALPHVMSTSLFVIFQGFIAYMVYQILVE